MSGDAAVQLDLHIIVADILDIVLERYLTLVYIHMLAVFDLGGYFLSGDTAEELAAIARLSLDDELRAFKLFFSLLGVGYRRSYTRSSPER